MTSSAGVIRGFIVEQHLPGVNVADSNPVTLTTSFVGQSRHPTVVIIFLLIVTAVYFFLSLSGVLAFGLAMRFHFMHGVTSTVVLTNLLVNLAGSTAVLLYAVRKFRQLPPSGTVAHV